MYRDLNQPVRIEKLTPPWYHSINKSILKKQTDLVYFTTKKFEFGLKLLDSYPITTIIGAFNTNFKV